jgi:hypothetical protein
MRSRRFYQIRLQHAAKRRQRWKWAGTAIASEIDCRNNFGGPTSPQRGRLARPLIEATTMAATAFQAMGGLARAA